MNYDEIAAQEAQQRSQAPVVDDTYDSMAAAEAEQRKRTLKASLNVATQSSPDKAGKIQTLADKSGFPVAVVERNEDYIAQQQRVREIQQAVLDSPILARQLSDPAFAKLAHDDVSNLVALGDTMRPVEGPAPGARSVARGLLSSFGQGLEGMRQGIRQQFADLMGFTDMSADAARKGAGVRLDRALTTPEFETSTARGVYGGLSSVIQQAPGIAATIATGNPALMLAAIGVQSEAEAYSKYRARGADPVAAATGALGEGATEVLTEMVPMGFLVKKLGKVGAGEFLTGLLAREIPSEQVATLVQDAIDTAVANPEKTWGQYAAERPGAAYETLVATVTQAGVMAGASGVIRRGSRQSEQATQNADAIAQVLSLAGESKLRERNPAAFKQFIESATAGSPVDAVYVDAAMFAQDATKAGIDIAAAMPETAAGLQDAIATNSDVRIPLSELATAIPGTTLEQSVIEHLRASPEAATQKEVSDPEHVADTKAKTEQVLAEHEAGTAWKQSAATVERELFTQLQDAKRFTPDVNKAYAGFMSAFYSTQAHRLAITPAEMFAKYPLQIRASGVGSLHQGTEPRASFEPSTNTITLLAKADLSSFLHEGAHFYLEVMHDMARQQNAPAAIVDDFNKTLKWFGVKAEQWAGMTLEEKRVHHEQWARGFESYLFEGKAPSVELTNLFARFRAWMINVYRKLQSLNVTLDDEVRGVMARLLATNDEIIAAESARRMLPLFATKPAEMSAAEWTEYQSLGLEATQEAVDQLQRRSVRDMQYSANARSRALSQLQRDATDKRKVVRAEVAAEVAAMPVYAAERWLKHGEMANQDGEEIKAEKGFKLDADAVNALFPGSMLARPDLTKLGHGQYGMLEKGGLAPDLVAEMFGMRSGDELVRKLIDMEPRDSVVEGLTDQRMLERHGDLADPASIAKAADAAVHNEVRAKFIATELRALDKASGNKNLLTAAAKQFAAAIVGRKALRDVKPGQYAAAEARAAKAAQKALAKNDIAAATAAQRTRLINLYATRAAYDALTEIDKGVVLMRRVTRGTSEEVAKTRDVDVVMAARAILADYGIGTKGKAAVEYLDAVKNYDPAMYEVLRDRVDALTQNAKPYQQLTVDEFRALRDEIGAMMHLARRSRQMEVDGDLIDREEVQAELRARMEEIGIPDTVPGEGRAVTDGERRLAMFQTARAALRRVESWVGVKDGDAPMGPFRKYVWQQVKDAADKYRADKAVHLKRYHALLDAIAPSLAPSRIDAPEIHYTFGFSRGGSGTAEILHAILHTGNASNKRKLLLGRHWAKENADGSLDTSQWDAFVSRMITEGKVTKAHFDFAQGVWDMFEATKPLAQKTHRDVFGHYFAEVTAESFTTPFGVYAGGYVPALADPEVVTDAKTRALMEEENSSLAFAFPSTNKGFTKGRVEYNRPLLLDLRVMSQHLDKVLLFSHLEQPIRDVRRVLTAKGVGSALNRIDPAAFDGLLTPWLNRTARQQVESPIPGSGGLMRFFSAARSRAGMAAMFANVSNTVQQITGMSTAMVKVKPKYLMSAVADFVAHPQDFIKAVSESSVYMNSRMENEVQQLTEQINDILLNPSVYEKAQAWTVKHAYFLQSSVDNVLSPIVWTGAYNQALEQGVSERDALRLADGVVRETQGSTLPEEVSRMETGNAFVRMFTQFAGYFNTQANMLGTEFAKVSQDVGLKKGAGRGLYIFTFGFLAPAWIAEAIAQAFRGGPDDDDKDGSYLDDWLKAVFGFSLLRYGTAMVPVVGQVANAAVNTLNKKPYDDRISTAPAISMIESAVQAPHSVYKAIVDDGKPGKAVKDVATLLTLVLGLPVSAVARPVSYLVDAAANKVHPTGPADAVRGTITGVSSPESKR